MENSRLILLLLLLDLSFHKVSIEVFVLSGGFLLEIKTPNLKNCQPH